MSSSQGLFGHASPAFGTPSYPSHLDMIRVNEPGLSTSDISNYSSHEMNNNFLDPVIHEAKYGNYDFSQREEDLSSSKSKFSHLDCRSINTLMLRAGRLPTKVADNF